MSTREWFAVVTGRSPASQPIDLQQAIRRLVGVSAGMSLQKAIRVISSALEGGMTLPRSALLALGHHALKPKALLDRATRLRAATALSAIHERAIDDKAIQLICRDNAPLDVINAAAAMLLGPSRRRLNKTTTLALTRHIRRYAQIRGPMVDLLRLSARLESHPS